MAIDYEALKAELLAGFPGSSDSVVPAQPYDADNALAADQLNASGAYTAWTRIVPHVWTTPADMNEVIAAGAITGLANPKRADWDAAIAPMYNLDQFPARGRILDHLQAIFGLGSPTYIAYIDATQDITSRAVELGFGVVNEGDVIQARSI